jgi:hypothetical protein
MIRGEIAEAEMVKSAGPVSEAKLHDQCGLIVPLSGHCPLCKPNSQLRLELGHEKPHHGTLPPAQTETCIVAQFDLVLGYVSKRWHCTMVDRGMYCIPHLVNFFQ